MISDEVWQAYHQLLYSEVVPERQFPAVAPLLAHYTSLTNLERIVENEEIWLSNPLSMNDVEEVRFGVHSGLDVVHAHSGLKSALGTTERSSAFLSALENAYDKYSSEHVLDLYVACFSLHTLPRDEDGRLSMWRGYGKNGKGAAIVFDTSQVPGFEESSLVLAPVDYATREDRRQLERVAFNRFPTLLL